MPVIDRNELGAWLRLSQTPGLGNASARRLLSAFGSPERVLQATPGALRQVIGAKAALLEAASPEAARRLEDTWRWRQGGQFAQRTLIPLGDASYPPLLLAIADPPLLLHVEGRRDLLTAPALAIVGSRNPSPQGQENAHAFAACLGKAGLAIVSGMALGIDGAAHTGALDAQAATIAVVGTGLDTVYPPRHAGLARRIIDNGLIVSEYPIGTPPLAANFPRRNRVIAGLARGTLVVEAALRSGSLITARLANEAGRDVFAIPGSIHAPQSRGCHALIKQGAKLVETASDLLEEMNWPVRPVARPRPADPLPDPPLVEALGHDPVTLDALAARTGMAAADLQARLLALELEGVVARLPGQLFQRVSTGRR